MPPIFRQRTRAVRNAAAFTLVEIMVAIVILVIITLIMAEIFGGTQALVAQEQHQHGLPRRGRDRSVPDRPRHLAHGPARGRRLRLHQAGRQRPALLLRAHHRLRLRRRDGQLAAAARSSATRSARTPPTPRPPRCSSTTARFRSTGASARPPSRRSRSPRSLRPCRTSSSPAAPPATPAATCRCRRRPATPRWRRR